MKRKIRILIEYIVVERMSETATIEQEHLPEIEDTQRSGVNRTVIRGDYD